MYRASNFAFMSSSDTSFGSSNFICESLNRISPAALQIFECQLWPCACDSLTLLYVRSDSVARIAES